MENSITIGTVCFIQDKKQQKVLLLHRGKSPMRDLWTGVGGKTEFLEDIHGSCRREIFEETGLTPSNVCLKGIVKTILEGGTSSWILFVYTADCPETELGDCNEGTLEWAPIEKLSSYKLIGFIRAILPQILSEHAFFEGTIVHDLGGEVVSIQLRLAGKTHQPLVAADQMTNAIDGPVGTLFGGKAEL